MKEISFWLGYIIGGLTVWFALIFTYEVPCERDNNASDCEMIYVPVTPKKGE